MSILRFFGYCTVFVMSFLLFLMVTFPRDILKDYVGNQVGKHLGARVSIGSIGWRFPVGLEVEDVEILRSTGEALRLQELGVAASPWPLGRVAIRVFAGQAPKKFFAAEVQLSLADLVAGAVNPQKIYVDSQKFSMVDLVGFGVWQFLRGQSGSNPALAFIRNDLEKMVFEGELNIVFELDLDMDDPRSSIGKADIALDGSRLFFRNGAFPEQIFEVAKINGRLENAVFTFGESEVRSKDIGTNLSGRIFLKPFLAKSELKLSLDINLQGELADTFGMFLAGGQGSVSVLGTMNRPLVSVR